MKLIGYTCVFNEEKMIQTAADTISDILSQEQIENELLFIDGPYYFESQ